MSIELLKQGYEDFLSHHQVITSSPYVTIISQIVTHLIAKECASAKPPEKPQPVVPQNWITIKQFWEKTMIAAPNTMSVFIREKKLGPSLAVKVKGEWYIDPIKVISLMAQSKDVNPSLAKRAKLYLKNNSEK